MFNLFFLSLLLGEICTVQQHIQLLIAVDFTDPFPVFDLIFAFVFFCAALDLVGRGTACTMRCWFCGDHGLFAFVVHVRR